MLEKLVSVYMNIQNERSDLEKIKDILNEIKTLNLNANTNGDKYIY